MMCHVSCVMYHVYCVRCHVSCVMCHLSQTPTAKATDPPPAYYPTRHSRLVLQKHTPKTKTITKPRKFMKTFLGFCNLSNTLFD